MLKALCGKIKRLSFLSCWLYFYLFGSVISGIIEIVEEQACESHEFRLTCRKLDSHIAILEAWFTHANLTQDEGAVGGGANLTQCAALRFQDSYLSTRLSESDYEKHVVLNRNESENLRGPISYRCTGVNHCSFILPNDHKPAATWGPGSIYLKYACVDDSRSLRFCNREVWAGGAQPSEGFVRSPGYPHYYVGDSRCRWALRAPRGQRLRLTLFDVDLRNIGPWEDSCTDELVVQDVSTGEELLSRCSQVDTPLVLESRADALDVLVKADSEYAYPKRGVLFHYKTLGCITPAAPSDGYLIYREAMAAHYMCCVRYIFADTRQRARTITCLNDNTWNETLPEKCIEDPLAAGGTAKASDISRSDSTDMLVDIVIPSLLIAALFIGNAFIVLIIYKYRKRKEDDQDDEFNTIPLSPNGYASSMANAV